MGIYPVQLRARLMMYPTKEQPQMRYTVVKSVVQVIGPIWMPPITAAQAITLSEYDIENIRGRVSDGNDITREDVDSWLSCHAGDFQSITDFRADIADGDKGVVFEWANEESELTYNDCMFGEED